MGTRTTVSIRGGASPDWDRVNGGLRGYAEGTCFEFETEQTAIDFAESILDRLCVKPKSECTIKETVDEATEKNAILRQNIAIAVFAHLAGASAINRGDSSSTPNAARIAEAAFAYADVFMEEVEK